MKPIQQQTPQVAQSIQVRSSTLLQVWSFLLETGSGKLQVGDRADQGVVDPQLLSQVIDPNTKFNL